MGGGEGSEEEEDDGIFRRRTPYTPQIRGRYWFDSELMPKTFVRNLKRFLDDKYDIVPVLDDRKWRLNFTVESELDDAERERGVRPNFSEIRIDLLEEDLTPAGHFRPIGVKFTQVKGSWYLFSELKQAIQDYFLPEE